MSQKANYFKLGLFVIGAIVALIATLVIVGSGRWFQPRVTVETYFNESVQGLDIGSKMKYRGVVVGEVTKITFTYAVYQQDLPPAERKRYVLVQGRFEPRLVGGRVAGELTNPEAAALEIEKGLRMRLAPMGITGTSYLEIDYVDPATNPVLPISWTPDNLYIPSTKSTVLAFVNAASNILENIHRVDFDALVYNVNTLLKSLNERVAAVDAKGLSDRANRTLAQIEKTMAGIESKKLSSDASALLTELRASNAELRKTLANPALQKLPDDASAAVARMKELVNDPRLTRSLADLQRSLDRVDRILGGGEGDIAVTIENLRQITDNLRDLTEDAKRYPARVIFGAPPRPLEYTP
jgi:ABC-type transporter Mla subunit MlaD